MILLQKYKLILELGILLVSSDEFDADSPQQDVADNKKPQDDQGNDDGDAVGDHQHPVEETMGQHRREQTQQKIADAPFLVEFGQ